MLSAVRQDVSVVIVSYRRPHLIGESIRSVLAQTHKPKQVLVVDNRSDRSEEVRRVVEGFPSVELIANDGNLGFSRAVNRGLKRASGDFIHITEDDIVLDARFIEKLLEFHRKQPGPKLLGGIMIQWENGRPIEDKRPLFSGGDIALDPSVQVRLFDLGRLPDEPIRSPFLPGAMIFGCREAFRLLGGFREDFFLYEEDVELCLRGARLGISVHVVPQAITYHKSPISLGKAPEVQFSKLKNNLTVNLLYLPSLRIPRFLASCLLHSVRGINSPKSFLVVSRFWGWALCRLPGLLIERRRGVAKKV
jgi:GT2 family glycosyltransferase